MKCPWDTRTDGGGWKDAESEKLWGQLDLVFTLDSSGWNHSQKIISLLSKGHKLRYWWIDCRQKYT